MNSSNRYIIYSLFLLALGLALFKYFHSTKPSPILSQNTGPRDNTSERVNYHIRKVDNQRRFDQLKTEVENSQITISPGERKRLEPLPTGTSINETSENSYHNMAADLESESSRKRFASTPEDQVNEWIENMQLRRDFDSKYRDEFVAAFIENAAQQGYLVKVDDNLRIVEVRRIPSRMPQSVPQRKKKPAPQKK